MSPLVRTSNGLTLSRRRKRRIDDIESGREVGIPGEEVMVRMRKLVGL